MTNPEHLKILESGVDEWNKWRDENPNIIPKLSGAKLQGKSLNNINFRSAELLQVNLSKASLQRADFSRALLFKANLMQSKASNANFKNANLQEANLNAANFKDAVFWNANLQKAQFIDTKLDNTKFWEANLAKAQFIEREDKSPISLNGADLWGAKVKRTYFSSRDIVKSLYRPLSVEQEREVLYLDNTQQIVTEPFIQLPQQALKARRSLLFTSVLCGLRALPGVVWPPSITISGNTIKGLDALSINCFIMAITLYFGVYFLFTGWETYSKWKLRRTGAAKDMYMRNGGGSIPMGYSEQLIEQSTAYADAVTRIVEIKKDLKGNSFDLTSETERFAKLIKHLDPLLLHSTKRFWRHQQLVVRRFVLEFHFPLLLAISAIGFLAWKSFS